LDAETTADYSSIYTVGWKDGIIRKNIRRGVAMSDDCPSGGKVTEPAKSKPPVWRWYVAYCSGMVALYLVVAACGVIMLVVDPVELDMEAMLAKLLGAFNLGFGILLVGLFGAAPFLPPKPWTWIYGIVAIGIGLSGLCCLPAAVPLLIYWLKPETKAYFGRPDA
jgi:hypothetical protein